MPMGLTLDENKQVQAQSMGTVVLFALDKTLKS